MLPFHPYADLFPLIEGGQFAELVADVKVNDIREKIYVWDGAILDGRNRYRAGLEAGLIDDDDGPDRAKYFIRFVPAVDGNPLAFVMSKNLQRRHLDESQRAMVAARYATMRQGERTDIEPEPSANLPKVDQAAAAKTLSISERALRHARRVQDYGEPELARAVDRGQLAVSVAEKASRLTPAIQRRIAAEAEAGNTSTARGMVKKEARNDREAELSEKQRALPTKKYGLIYCDIPRHFNVHSDETGLDRAPENHYPTMSFDETCNLPVADLAADDSILVFWSTAASLFDDIEIMAEWGFVSLRPRTGLGKLSRPNGIALPPVGGGTYRSMQVWDKIRIGLGYWFRDRHEFILIGVRGNAVPPAPGTQDQSLFSEAKGEHSAKPDRVADMLKRLWPSTPKIELFARQAREGWDRWGYEAPVHVGVDPGAGDEITTYAAPPNRENALTPATVEALPEQASNCLDVEVAAEDDPHFIPEFLRRPLVPVASPRATQLADAERSG